MHAEIFTGVLSLLFKMWHIYTITHTQPKPKHQDEEINFFLEEENTQVSKFHSDKGLKLENSVSEYFMGANLPY